MGALALRAGPPVDYRLLSRYIGALYGLEKLRADKAEGRGGFNDRIVWSGNSPAADTPDSNA
jgi:hypothetical protein